MKHLILRFGYNAILELCERKGWRLPYASEIGEIEYDEVWVQDLPDEEYRETHAYVWNKKRGTLILCNKKFMENVVVIKE